MENESEGQPWLKPAIFTGGTLVVLVLLAAVADINLLRVLVNGLQTGAVYAIVALGIALVYKATRVLNFAQGAFGTVPAFLVLMIVLGFNLEKEVDPATVSVLEMVGATVVAMIAGAVLAIIVNLGIVRRLASASPVTSLVATAGVTLFLIAGQIILFEVRSRKFPRFIDGAPRGLDLGPICLATTNEGGVCAGDLSIGGIVVPWHTLIVLLVLAVAAILLAIFFRTPPGVALLATAQDPFAAEIYGISPVGMSTIAWGMGGALAAIGGVLGAGVFEQLAPGLMTSTFLIPAFTAAVLGGINSMPGAVVGGMLLGVTVALANQVVLRFDLTSTLPGPPQLASFVVLLLVLLFRPRGLLGKEA